MATAPAEATPPRLRLATAADAAVIARLINQAFAGYRDWLKPPPSALNETPESIARLLAAQQGAVAEIEDRPAGCALFRPQGRDVERGRLSVLPADQGKGIARALIDFVETRGEARGPKGLVV